MSEVRRENSKDRHRNRLAVFESIWRSVALQVSEPVGLDAVCLPSRRRPQRCRTGGWNITFGCTFRHVKHNISKGMATTFSHQYGVRGCATGEEAKRGMTGHISALSAPMAEPRKCFTLLPPESSSQPKRKGERARSLDSRGRASVAASLGLHPEGNLGGLARICRCGRVHTRGREEFREPTRRHHVS